MGSKSIQTARYLRRLNREKTCCSVLRVITLITTILFSWICDIGCGYGIISNANAGDNWPESYALFGEMLVAAAILLTVGCVFILIRRYLPSLILSIIAIALIIVATIEIVTYASDSAFYSKLMDMPASEVYCLELLPTLLPALCMLILSLIAHCGNQGQERRREKKERENATAPSILD